MSGPPDPDPAPVTKPARGTTSVWAPAVLATVRALLTGTYPGNAGEPVDDEPTSGESAGAALHVDNADDTLVFAAPLARMSRVDDDDPSVLWIRPITGRSTPPEDSADPVPRYSLSAARRRSLAATGIEVHTVAGEPVVEITLRSGQRARICRAAGAELAELEAWDTFTLTVLSAEEEAALEALTEDSWHGPDA